MDPNPLKNSNFEAQEYKSKKDVKPKIEAKIKKP
tara:strand:+ start:1195 stop:1296 length:102 start_codon:yes stop_codon:yes gene_type:complete